MSVQLDHAIVPARDRRAAAELLAALLGDPDGPPWNVVFMDAGKMPRRVSPNARA